MKPLNQNKMTAVEWLFEQLDVVDSSISYELFNQAKEMEKEQKIEFANKYAKSDSLYCGGEFGIEKGAEQYYNETFKSE